MLEILVKGSGELIVGLVDQKGKVLLRKRLILSGPEGIEAKSRLPLILESRGAQVAVIPVLIHQSTEKQVVTFAGQDHAVFTAQRCKELKAQPSVIERAAKLAAEQARERGLLLSFGGKSRSGRG